MAADDPQPQRPPRQRRAAPEGGVQGESTRQAAAAPASKALPQPNAGAGRGAGARRLPAPRGGKGASGLQQAPPPNAPAATPQAAAAAQPRGTTHAGTAYASRPAARGGRGGGGALPGGAASAPAVSSHPKAQTAAPRPPTRGGAAAAAAPVVRTAAPQRGGGASAAAAEEARQAEAQPQHRGVGSVTGTVALPRELHHSRAEEVARRVYDTLAVASVEPRGDVFTVAASSAQVVDQACLLLDTLVAQQLQLQRRFGLKDRLADDVSRVQAEIEAGLRCEFNVDPNLLGLVIGPGGANVRRVTEETQVDRIVIDRQASVVRIVGHRPEDVARAREMLEVCCLYIPLPEDKVGFVVGKEGRNINDIIARSGLVAPGGMTMDRSRGAMRVQGTRAACEKARLLIEAQLDFLNQAEREQVEVEAMRQKLEHMQTNWGEDSTVVYRGGGGHGGAAHSRGGGGGGQYRGRGDSDYHR